MRVPALVQRGLFRADFIISLVHEDGARHVGEARVKAASDQDIPVSEADGD